MKDTFSIVGLKAKNPFILQSATSKPEFIIDLQKNNPFVELGGIYVADPFVYTLNGVEYLFCELLLETNKGVIARLERNLGEINWKNPKIIMEENFHLSYPLIYEYKNNFFMVVESADISEVRIYKAKDSNLTTWKYNGCLLSGVYYDPTIFKHNECWFMFACTQKDFSKLHLFYSKSDIMGPWVTHPKSPLESNNSSSRSAGPILEWESKQFRLAQDCSIRYGQSVKAFEIKILTTDEFVEEEIGTILTNSVNGWNSHGMHHLQVYKKDKEGIHVVSDGYTKK